VLLNRGGEHKHSEIPLRVFLFEEEEAKDKKKKGKGLKGTSIVHGALNLG